MNDKHTENIKMAHYTHKCNSCDEEFLVVTSIDTRNETKECDSCGINDSKLIITTVGINFVGDGWVTKNDRISRQMREKNLRLGVKSRERAREQPVSRLVPNIGGEQTDSWQDAQRMAKSKGLSTSSYNKVVAKEAKAKVQ